MKKLNSKSLMPHGAHKGKLMSQVPAIYLIHIYIMKQCDEQIKEYIKENFNELQIKANYEENINQ